ncbi:hypothetical protein IU487_32790 [Nocardia puris]|uniref:hypothetical protein n=1 Tax=Nocardia puris TaxID=208602 RepID=UPI0018938946|nr:hypothetical protein [Nocardia puris]MBF6215777.1 hypothetical protein [Nocardia puris]
MTEHTPARRRRHTGGSASRRAPAVEVPATIWAAGINPIEATDQWPTPIVSRGVTEFSHPGDQVLLVPPASAAPGTRPFLAPDTATALTMIDDLGRHSLIERPAGSPDARHPQKPHDEESVALILASFLPPETTPPSSVGEVVALAASRLNPGGVLVVLTRCTHTRDGVLLDPTGSTVAAAQAADLLFLQHIVAVPIAGDAVSAPAINHTRPAQRHRIVHVDITVLLRP